MSLPTGSMPHSADFTAPTDATLHLPSSKLDSRRPAGHEKKSSSIKLFSICAAPNLGDLRWAPDHTSLHQLNPALLASGDAARGGMRLMYFCMSTFHESFMHDYFYCGVCLCMLDQPLKKYLLSVYIIPCGAREFFCRSSGQVHFWVPECVTCELKMIIA